jgi:glycosyltransferase involved in cell wall biosynthesis
MHLLHVFPSFQIGGAQRRFAALANHFGGLFKHTIISLDGCLDARTLLNESVDARIHPAPPKANLIKTIRRARQILADVKPDALITYNWGAIEWAAANLIQRLRHIHIEDGFGPEEAAGQLKRRVLFRRFVLNVRSLVVLPSRTLVAIATDIWRIDPKRVLYVPNGIPCTRFQSLPRQQIQFKGHGPVIGTVATLRKEKALDRLIHAFWKLQQHKTARLVIAGDGAERRALENLVASYHLDDRVTFTGNLGHPEEALAGFDVFAVTSDTEQMPLSVLEAMAAGLPVVSTDVGDIRSMVSDENRPFLVDRDSNAVANAIDQLLEDAALRERLGTVNRARAMAEYDEDKMFSTYRQVFSAQP